ncbi:MAG: hypothetical protein ACJAQ3_002255 [Planctomycetota bacterium]|jgi:hypothetical protein
MTNSPTSTSSEVPETESLRVQVVARWNSWVQVRDPRDDSLRWIDLSESAFEEA